MITIINYGLGNIQAFANIYRRLNVALQVANTAEDLSTASKLILPGVGAFDHAMSALNNSGMRAVLEELVLDKKTPVLGVCVGMQMMADSSEEGILPGLGWIKGRVKKIDTLKLSPQEPLPHMGWNNVIQKKEDVIFKNLPKNAYFYFLHSYYFQCDNPENTIGMAHYGEDFSCVINSDNIYGIQCHPEKSHSNGVTFLKNFGEL